MSISSLRFSLLFLSLASADPGEELLAIKNLVADGDGMNIGALSPHTNSLSMGDLKALESTLQPLRDASTRDKRQVGNFNSQLMFDEVDDEELSDDQVDADVRSTLHAVELPLSKGQSALSIKANTVYILYPSLFQDPNIFGRFAINQNVDSSAKQTKTATDNVERAMQLPLLESLRPPLPPMALEKFNYQPHYARQYKRSVADNFFPQPQQQQQLFDETPEEKEKRNVETHLSGSIVVLNQDISEKNTKDSY